jgi:hypothetical protein
MIKAKDIKEKLLKQMDGDVAGTTEISETSAREIIDKHKTRLKRINRIAAIGWLITIMYTLAMHSLNDYLSGVKDYLTKNKMEGFFTNDQFMLVRYMDMGSAVLIAIAILLTYLAYNTSRSTTLLQICARLAGIEEQLKKLSENV